MFAHIAGGAVSFASPVVAFFCVSFGGCGFRQDSDGDDDDGKGGEGGGSKVTVDESTRRTWSMKDREEELKTAK